MNIYKHLRSTGKASRVVAGLASLLIATPSSVLAYSWSTCDGSRLKWNSAWTNMYISTTSFPAGTTWDSRLQNAMWHWNNVKNSRFNFYVGRDTDGTWSSGNGKNEVVLGTIDGAGGTLAVTKSRWKCYWAPLQGWEFGRIEADIVFDVAEPWTTGTIGYTNYSTYINFESTALHELGHALGLGHEDRVMATMNSKYPGGGTLGHWKEWDPLPDDRQGIRYLYGGDGTTEIDIAVSAFKRTGTGTSGLVTTPLSAARGSTVTFEYSLANQSTSAPAYDVGFYLSADSYISTSDTYLSGTYVSGGSASYMVTWTSTLTIPSWVQPGTYYLGVIADPYNQLAESNESNAYQEAPRTIRVD
jgi:hypothetical protein